MLSDAASSSSAKEANGSGSLLKNPLTYLFKRESSQTSKDKTENSSKQEKGRRKVLEKSVSMMEEFNRQEKVSRQHKKDLVLRELRSGEAKARSLTRTRTQPCHLGDAADYYSCDEARERDTPSPPPYPAPAQPSPPDTRIKEILSEGHYYSFDKVRSLRDQTKVKISQSRKSPPNRAYFWVKASTSAFTL